ncbi:MAG: YebC/PmpR family DNA-binding transcriptional regulator [Ignavibacteriae bacterium]|nr:YebC/PmpR family DNA-binding transcriptional regulator [Ignavibacteriota bacterium]
MGRAFEFRRARKEKRWAKMAKTFAKIGKEIAIAVRAGGPDPHGNARLRLVIQNAKDVNMPKDNVESAIKRAASKDAADFQEVVYEGYGPHGIAIVTECATDNPTRTVANIRMYYTRAGGALGTTGSLDFLFERKGMFTISAKNINKDELELELIDFGLEEFTVDGDEAYLNTSYADFRKMQKALEDKGVEVLSAELQRIPLSTNAVSPEQQEEIQKLLDQIEDDDDVQAVYHNMKIPE